MTTPNAVRIGTNWRNLSPLAQVQYRYDMALAQMASEVYGLRPGMSNAEMLDRLTIGNSVPDSSHLDDPDARIGNQRMTDSQARDFIATFRVVAASSETSAAGDYVLLLERRDGDGFVYSVRSTQPLSQDYNDQGNGGWEQDVANNRQMAQNGVGISQLDRIDRFVLPFGLEGTTAAPRPTTYMKQAGKPGLTNSRNSHAVPT